MKAPREMELLVLWLHRHRKTQKAAAEGIGTHKNYLSSIILGTRPLTLRVARKLEKWMRSVDPDDYIHASNLLGLAPPDEPPGPRRVGDKEDAKDS